MRRETSGLRYFCCRTIRTTGNDLRAVSRKTCLVEKFGCFQQKIQLSVNYAGRAEKTKTISGILSPFRRVDSIGLILKNGATSMGHLHCYNKSGDLSLIFEV